MCAKKNIQKVSNTEKRKQVQKELREFLRRNFEIEWKEIRPTGFQIDISTIPESKSEEFLRITSKLTNNEDIRNS